MISITYVSESATTRNDGDFVESSCIFGEHRYQSMSSLMIRRQLVCLFVWNTALLCWTYTQPDICLQISQTTNYLSLKYNNII